MFYVLLFSLSGSALILGLALVIEKFFFPVNESKPIENESNTRVVPLWYWKKWDNGAGTVDILAVRNSARVSLTPDENSEIHQNSLFVGNRYFIRDIRRDSDGTLRIRLMGAQPYFNANLFDYEDMSGEKMSLHDISARFLKEPATA